MQVRLSLNLWCLGEKSFGHGLKRLLIAVNDWVLGSFLHQGKQKYWLPGDSVNIMLGAICVAKAKIVKKQYVTVDCLVTPCNIFGILHKTQTIF